MSNFMASQDARLFRFEADLKQQQVKMTNKTDTVLKDITNQITRALRSDTFKNSKLNVNSTSPVSSARTYLAEDLQCSARIHSSINTITIYPKQRIKPHDDKPVENKIVMTGATDEDHHIMDRIEKKFCKLNSFLESSGLVFQSSDIEFVCTKEDDGDILFIEIIKKYDNSREEELRENENAATGGLEVEYFDTFSTRSELAYHKKLDPREVTNRGVSNFTGRITGVIPFTQNNFTGRIAEMHIFIGNFTYVADFMIVEDIRSIIDLRLSQVLLGKPFVEISNMTHDLSLGVVKFTDGINDIAYKIPYKIEQYNSLSDLEKEHTKSVYLRNEEDKRKRVEYVMSKILGFYKECIELRPKYLTGVADEGGVTLYLMRRNPKVLRKFQKDAF
ncbi:hypothetical protein Tco_0995025 [Tanacetum coccineum]